MMFFVDLVYVNSSWTYNNMSEIWNWYDNIDILYPPCNIEDFSRVNIEDSSLR